MSLWNFFIALMIWLSAVVCLPLVGWTGEGPASDWSWWKARNSESHPDPFGFSVGFFKVSWQSGARPRNRLDFWAEGTVLRGADCGRAQMLTPLSHEVVRARMRVLGGNSEVLHESFSDWLLGLFSRGHLWSLLSFWQDPWPGSHRPCPWLAVQPDVNKQRAVLGVKHYVY